MNAFRIFNVIFFSTLLVAPLAAQTAGATDGDSWCGAHPARLAATVARHQDHQRQLERGRALAEKSGLAAKASPNVYQYEQIAVIEDDGTLITPPRPFDLSGKSIQFLRRPKGMSAVKSNVGYKNLIGEEPFLFLFGATHVPFENGFRFPFFDQVYDEVWVHENGYLTFQEPDLFAPTENVLDLLLGEPAIAPCFAGLNPTGAGDAGGVYVKFLPRRARFTWLNVPELGSDRRVTAQVTLFDTGRILFAYGDVEASYGAIGIFPGGEVQEDVISLDFSAELPQPPRRAALAEFFLDESQVDELAVIDTFYEHFEDRYGQMIVWFDFPLTTGDGDGASQFTLKNDVQGIGVPAYDLSRFLGLSGLESYVQMGRLDRYPSDPQANVVDTYSTMDLLAHQVGHRWLGMVTHASYYGGNQGGSSLNLLDFPNLEHWSFYAHTDGSVLGGNAYEDNGDGTFTTAGATSKYCPLDLYLMGLIPATDVPDFYYLQGVPMDGLPSSSTPRIGVTTTGNRVDVGMWQVTESMGPRVPPAAEAPDVFNMAFVLLTRDGEPPSAESLEKLDYFRRYWHRYFKEATDFNGRVNTTLRPK